MTQIKQNLDFLVILILVFVLGISHMTERRTNIRTIRMEQPGGKLRMHPYAQTIPFTR